jgi:hypothetical protein
MLFKNGYCGRPMSNSLTGNPIENMLSEVKKPCRKPGLTYLQETDMLFGPLYQTLGMKLLHLSVTCDLKIRVHAEMNEICG